VVRQLPAAAVEVTYPTGGNPASWGTVAYDVNAPGGPDYWYQPYASYSGNFTDEFWYSWENAAGQWSNWALVHINVQADYAC
jgi:hypothetical protein